MHFYEHPEPLMVPYNFDMTGFSGPGGYPGDFHPSLPIGHEAAALHGAGALGAETNSVISNVTGATAVNNTPGLSAYATVGKVKHLLFKTITFEKNKGSEFNPIHYHEKLFIFFLFPSARHPPLNFNYLAGKNPFLYRKP